MTVKERLIARIEAMTEEDAGELLRIAELRARDPLLRLWTDAPDDDEPWTSSDEAARDEVEADRRQGVARLSAEEVERELGLG